MPVKTDWFETEVSSPKALSGIDPFQAAQLPAMEPLTLDMEVTDLQHRLNSLIKREGGLDHAGVTCRIKDSPETSCLACPLNQIGEGTAKAALCSIGCEQERVITLMVAQYERR